MRYLKTKGELQMKKTLFSFIAVLLVVLIGGCSSDTGESSTDSTDSSDEVEKKDETISLGLTAWTSTVPPTKIASQIIQEMGYDVEEVDADTGSVYTGLSRGDIDVFMDSWMPPHYKYIEKYEETIDNIAVSYGDASTGWVVPEYMEDFNSIGDIKGKEEMFDNEMYSIESGTATQEGIDELIEVMDLDIEQINSSEGAMIAMAMRKMEEEEPVVFYGWRPHSMFSKFDIKVLEDESGLFGDPAEVHVVVYRELEERAPDVYEFLTNWSIPIDDVEDMIARIDDGADEDEVAAEWIEDNQDKVDEMLGK